MHSPVLLVGQAPGAREVAVHRPFAWTAGNFRGGFYWPGTSNNLDALAGEDGGLDEVVPPGLCVLRAGYRVQQNLDTHLFPVADQQLGDQDRYCDDHDAQQVDENERAAAADPDDVGEFPDVAEADG